MSLSRDYIAGFFDGEGSIGIYQSKSNRKYRSWRLHVNAAQVEPEVIIELHKRFGGSINLYERSKKMKNRRDCWYWFCSGRVAEKFLRFVLDGLCVKKAQAEVALLFMENRMKPGHSYKDAGTTDPGGSYAERLKHMKKTGQDILALH